MNLDRLMNYLRGVEETQLVDLLGLTSEDILLRFEDVVLERRAFLERELEVIPDSVEELDFDDD